MISSYDFDQLSAYLDDQLVPAEKASLEARLAAEPELRATLRELRLTVRVLRALPPVALPRSFVLTPAQVAARTGAARPGRPARRSLAPALRLATAFSAVALALVIFTDLRDGVLTASPAAQVETVLVTTSAAEAPADAGPAPSDTPTSDEGVEILEFAASEAATTPPAGDGTAGGDAAVTDPAVAADAQATPAGSALLAPEPSITATPSAERDGATPVPEADTGTKNAGPTVTGTPLTVAQVAATPAATPDDNDRSADTAGGAPPVAPTPAPGPANLRVIELGLALLTVLLGLAAWLTRR